MFNENDKVYFVREIDGSDTVEVGYGTIHVIATLDDRIRRKYVIERRAFTEDELFATLELALAKVQDYLVRLSELK